MTEYNETKHNQEEESQKLEPKIAQDETTDSDRKWKSRFKNANWQIGMLIGVTFWLTFDNIALGIALGVIFALIIEEGNSQS